MQSINAAIPTALQLRPNLQLLMLGQNQLTSHYPDWGLAKIYRQVKISAKPRALPLNKIIYGGGLAAI